MLAETNRNAFRRVRTRTSFEVRDLPFLRAVWFASRHGALFRPVSIPHACQGVCETSVRLDTGSVFRFRTAVASDRLLPPTTYPIANPRSRFSSRVLACAIPEMRSLTFHDVQARFGRIDASRWGLSPRDCRPCMFRVSEIRFDLGLWHLCRPAVFLAPSSQTIYELHTEAEARVLPSPREGCRPRNEPRSLPSVVPAGACQLVIDPCCSPSGIFRRAPPIGVGWSDESSPCHSKRSGRFVLRRRSEIATSRSSSRPRKERRPPGGWVVSALL